MIKTNEVLLTGSDKLRLADFTVAVRADGVHSVLVELTAARVSEVTRVVHRPALSHFASVVHRCGHIVEGVVGGLPAKDDHIAGAIVKGLRTGWSTGDWR